MKDLYFEELENVEEMGDVADFASAAAPWVMGGFTIALAIAT